MTGHDNVFHQRDCKVRVLTVSQEARGGCECKHSSSSSSSSSSVLGSFPWVWCSFYDSDAVVERDIWRCVCSCVSLFYFSYNCTVHAAAAVIAIIVPAWQVGRGHERVTLVGTAVLKEDVHTLLTVGLPRVRQCRIAVSIPCHDVHAVLERNRKRENMIPILTPEN